MMKAEILSDIKKAEEDARNMISAAKEAKAETLLKAKNKGREIINTADKESMNAREGEIAKAKDQILSEKKKLLKEGQASAEAIKAGASKHIAKATKFLTEEFKRAVNA